MSETFLQIVKERIERTVSIPGPDQMHEGENVGPSWKVTGTNDGLKFDNVHGGFSLGVTIPWSEVPHMKRALQAIVKILRRGTLLDTANPEVRDIDDQVL